MIIKSSSSSLVLSSSSPRTAALPPPRTAPRLLAVPPPRYGLPCAGCERESCVTCRDALYCSFVQTRDEQSAMSDYTTGSSSATISSGSSSTNSSPMSPSMTRRRRISKQSLSLQLQQANTNTPTLFYYERARPSQLQQQQTSLSQQQRFTDKLVTLSHFASLLCVLDCTILPVLLFVLPLVGVLIPSASTSTWMVAVNEQWLHALGHQLAIWFVLPVGTLSTLLGWYSTTTTTTTRPQQVVVQQAQGASRMTSNDSSNTTTITLVLGLLGLSLIAITNAGCSLAHFVEDYGRLGHVLHNVLHILSGHDAGSFGQWMHRLVNIVGCACLMTANKRTKDYKKQQATALCYQQNCTFC